MLEVAVVVDADLGDDVRGLAVADRPAADRTTVGHGHVASPAPARELLGAHEVAGFVDLEGAIGWNLEHADLAEEPVTGAPEPACASRRPHRSRRTRLGAPGAAAASSRRG